ncbi:hypothetical protein MMC21_003581 [Puttea exsequens]|nr:hypothetical protein [Puttea exsequens]
MATDGDVDDAKDRGLQTAISASLLDRRSSESSNGASEANEKSEPEPHKRISIEDRIKDLTMRPISELSLVQDPTGDTWVFIDAPPKQPEQDHVDYNQYTRHCEKPILMSKDTLTRFSPFFAKFYQPTAQHRIVRRKNVVKDLRASSQVKYVIDLTPPVEGDDQVYLMTELSCSKGIRLWHQASEIWRVSLGLVGGQDEYTTPNEPVSYMPSSATRVTRTDNVKMAFGQEGAVLNASNSASTKTTKSNPMTLEYSPIRHHSAIERVLAALRGQDPRLNSAPKVWTTFAVAKYFEIKHSPLDDYLIRWLRAYPNSYFLEVLPEASLKIGDGLENYDLARDAYAILVGEEALENHRRARKSALKSKQTTFGRNKEDLSEDLHTRIEYASKSFTERINNEFADFTGNGMHWIDKLPEFKILASYQHPKIKNTVKELQNMLKDYVRGAIYKVLCSNYDKVLGPQLPYPGGHDRVPPVDGTNVWTNLTLEERIFTRTFWNLLQTFSLFSGTSNFDIREDVYENSNLKQSDLEAREMALGTYHKIRMRSLVYLIENGTSWFKSNHPLPLFELPIRGRMQGRDDLLEGAQPQPGWNEELPVRARRASKRLHSPDSAPVFDDIRVHSADVQSRDHALGAVSGDAPCTAYIRPENERNTLPESPYKRRLPWRRDNLDDFPVEINPAMTGAQITQPGYTLPTQRLRRATVPTQPIDIPRDQNPTHTESEPIATSPTNWPSRAEKQDPMPLVTIPTDEESSAATAQADQHYMSQLGRAQPSHDWSDPEEYPLFRSERIDGGYVNNGYRHDLNLADAPSSPQPQYLKGSQEDDETEVKRPLRPSIPGTAPAFRQRDKSRPVEVLQAPKLGPEASDFFDLDKFFAEATQYIYSFAQLKLQSADHGERLATHEIGIANTLVCLTDNEWKYLPLWAGGNDDGSGGVFNDQVPIADTGFSTAGPDVHTGDTPASSSRASSDFDLVSTHSDATSTVNTSTAVNRSISDGEMHCYHVYSVDSVDTASSQRDDDGFTIVSDDTDDDDALARKIEAQEKMEMAEEAAAREAKRLEKENERVVDETYADIFGGEEDDDSDDTDRADEGDFDDEMDEKADEDEDLVLV